MRRTFHGGAAHQVGVGEVEGCFQAEVGLQNLPHLLAHVEEQPGTLQGHLAFLGQLWRRRTTDQTEKVKNTNTHLHLTSKTSVSCPPSSHFNQPMFAMAI